MLQGVKVNTQKKNIISTTLSSKSTWNKWWTWISGSTHEKNVNTWNQSFLVQFTLIILKDDDI